MRQKNSRAELITLFTLIFVLLNTFIIILYNLVFVFFLRWKYLPDYLFIEIFIIIVFIVGFCFRSFEIWKNSEKVKKASDNTLVLDKWRRKLISAVKDDVSERLKQSLNKQKLLDLEFAHESINKANFLNSGSKLEDNFFDVFKKEQKIILLGDPGAGKTTELLRLAKTLLSNIEDNNDITNHSDDEPIPVIFELTTWESSQKLENWLVEKLEFKYKIPESIGRELLSKGEILPLLDGLNEQVENLEKCLASIEAFTQENQYTKPLQKQQLLVCCRLQEFEKINKDNNFDFLKPLLIKELSKAQITRYFEEAERQDLLELFKMNKLFNKVNLPLHLKIMVEAYQISEVKQHQSTQQSSFHEVVDLLKIGRDAFLKRILTDYVDRKLSEFRPAKKQGNEKYFLAIKGYLKKQKNQLEKIKTKRIKKRLSWLARTMQEHKQKEFLIENIQPTWLEKSHQKWLYRICFGIISGLSLAIFSAFLSILIYQLINHFIVDYIMIQLLGKQGPDVGSRIKDSVMNVIIGISSGLVSGLISVVVYGEVNQVLFFDQFQLSWQKIASFWSNIPRKVIFIIVIFMSLPEKISANIFYSIYTHNSKKFEDKINIDSFHKALPGEIAVPDFHVSVDVFFIILLITLFLSHLPFSIDINQRRNRTYPNQGIISSAINAGTFTLIGTLFMTFVYVLLCHVILVRYADINNEIEFIKLASINAVIFGLCCGSFLGFIFGGITVIQHVILRLILWRSGSIPWNYERFLADAADRGFIIQIGGRYRFQHELLREHFAKL